MFCFKYSSALLNACSSTNFFNTSSLTTLSLKDLYSSLNPNDFWLDDFKKVRCFEENKVFQNGFLTYPFKCNRN